jgi:hypothetical protein
MSRTLIALPFLTLLPVALAAAVAHGEPDPATPALLRAAPPRPASAESARTHTAVASTAPRDTALAARMRAALSTKQPARRAHETPEAGQARKPSREVTWVCGEWVELWQGHGKGRTCEWRPATPEATGAVAD